MDFAAPKKKHRMSLTPMIDVVFLLLVFFMLASRFGTPVQIDLTLAGKSETPYSGPPRLVQIEPDAILLNGVEHTADTLVIALPGLMEKPEDTVILRSGEGTSLQRLVDIMELLNGAGMPNLVLVE